MDTTGFLPILWWALGGAAAVGAGAYMYMEYQAYLLRTNVAGIPGGLRFTSQLFVVEARYGAKQLVVQARKARYKRKPLPQGDETEQTGSLTATLTAAGLQIQIFRIVEKSGDEGAPQETGVSSIVFNASDELTLQATQETQGESAVLHLDDIPASIAQDFQRFSNSLRTWLDKVEHGLNMEIEARRMKDEEAARLAAQAATADKVAEDPNAVLTSVALPLKPAAARHLANALQAIIWQVRTS